MIYLFIYLLSLVFYLVAEVEGRGSLRTIRLVKCSCLFFFLLKVRKEIKQEAGERQSVIEQPKCLTSNSKTQLKDYKKKNTLIIIKSVCLL